MKKVKLALRNISIPALLALARNIIDRMTGNLNFPSPNPPIADITTAADTLEASLTASMSLKDASKAQTVALNLAEDNLANSLTLLGSHVENASGGNEQKIISSGMDVADTVPSIVPLYVVENFYATTGDEEGEINAMWTRLRNVGKHTYDVFVKLYGVAGAPWVLKVGTDQSKADIKGLVSLQKYEVKLVPMKENMPGPESEVIVCRAG